jgi:hypothetical protein
VFGQLRCDRQQGHENIAVAGVDPLPALGDRTDGQERQLEVELPRELMGHLHIEADQLPVTIEECRWIIVHHVARPQDPALLDTGKAQWRAAFTENFLGWFAVDRVRLRVLDEVETREHFVLRVRLHIHVGVERTYSDQCGGDQGNRDRRKAEQWHEAGLDCPLHGVGTDQGDGDDVHRRKQGAEATADHIDGDEHLE